MQTGIPKHLQKDEILGGVHEINGEMWCFLMVEDASLSIPTRNILCFKKKTRDFWSWFERSKKSLIPLRLFIALAGESKGTQFH